MFDVFIAALLMAQVPPAPVPMPVPARVAGMPPSQMTNDGITVNASASVRAPATSATLTLHVNAPNNTMTLNATALQPLVDALVRAGVDRQSIALPFYLQGPVRTNNAQITGRILHPTMAMLKTGIEQIGSAFSSMPGVTLTGVDVRLQADNCDSLFRQAQAAALRQARASAEYIAKQLHVRAGSVLAVQGPFAGDPEFGCSSAYSFGPFGSSQPLTDGQSYFSVRVFSSVTARYEIRR